MSPNQRNKEKKPLKVYLPRELHLKFSRLAEQHGCNMSDLLYQYILNATRNIKLTVADYASISDDIQRNVKY